MRFKVIAAFVGFVLIGVILMGATDLRKGVQISTSNAVTYRKTLDFANDSVTTNTTVYLATIPARSYVLGVSAKVEKVTGTATTVDVSDTHTTKVFLTAFNLNTANNVKCSHGDSLSTATRIRYYPGGSILTATFNGTNPKRGRAKFEVTFIQNQ